jgi:hypothetical protein
MKRILIPETSPDGVSSVLVDYLGKDLFVQTVDAYGVQREISVRLDEGELHVFANAPVIRRAKHIATRERLELFVNRLREISENYPAILFQAQMPRSRGFVMLHEVLLSADFDAVEAYYMSATLL